MRYPQSICYWLKTDNPQIAIVLNLKCKSGIDFRKIIFNREFIEEVMI
jgi:hypothetical protein